MSGHSESLFTGVVIVKAYSQEWFMVKVYSDEWSMVKVYSD